jgi:hypothetical protein
VADAPLTASGLAINATQGSAFSGVVVNFTDADANPNLGDFSATIAWGDGNSSVGAITQNADGSFSVSGSNTYQAVGSYAITVTINDAGGSTVTGTSTASVANVPLAAAGLAINGSQGTAFTGAVATFTDADINSTLKDFSATITWGDGNSSTGTITQNADGSFTVSGSNTYQAIGTFAITVVINDTDGSTATATSTANIVSGDLPLAGTATSVSATQFVGQDLIVAQFSDADPNGQVGNYTASIDWGDGTRADTGRVTQPGGPGTPFFVDFMHAYNDVGTFNVHVNITDNGGSSDGGGAFIDIFSTVTVGAAGAPQGPGGARAGSAGRGLFLGVNEVHAAAQPLHEGTLTAILNAASASMETASSVPSGRASADDAYWQLLGRNEGFIDPNGWTSYQLALAIGGATI